MTLTWRPVLCSTPSQMPLSPCARSPGEGRAHAQTGFVEDGRAEVGAELEQGALPTDGRHWLRGSPPHQTRRRIRHPGLQNQAPLGRHPGCPISLQSLSGVNAAASAPPTPHSYNRNNDVYTTDRL